MKRFFGLMFLLFSLPVFAEGEKMNIGVADLQSRGVDESSTAIISDRLRTALYKEGGLTVIERNAMQEILKEQGFQQSGCTSDACAIEVGQLLGVNYMVVGTVGKLGRLYTIDVRMIQVATAKIIYSESIDCDCPIEKVLTNSVVLIAQKIAQHVNRPTNDSKKRESNQITSTTLVRDSTKTTTGKENGDNHTVEKRPRKFPALSVSLGAVALAAGAAGIIFDQKMKSEIEENSRLKRVYSGLSDGDARYAEYLSQLKTNASHAESYQTKRNVSYVLAGLGLAGFAISFAF